MMEALVSPCLPSTSFSSYSSPSSARGRTCCQSNSAFLSGGRLPISLHRLSVSPDKCTSCHHPRWFHRNTCGLRARCRRIAVLDEQATGAASSEQQEKELELEDEIYDFMIRSPNPNRFPTANDLLEAGRMDLVQAMASRGGWLCLGWNLEEEGEGGNPSPWLQAGAHVHAAPDYSSDIPEETEADNGRRAESSVDASSSGRPPIETKNVDNDAGVEGILRRLEKERSVSFGLEERERRANGRSSKGSNNTHKRFPSSYGEKGSRSMPLDLCDDFCSNFGIDSSLLDTNFSNFNGQHASESKIISNKSETCRHAKALNGVCSGEKNPPGDDSLNENENDASRKLGNSQIHLRLRQMELKLKAALDLLKSKSAVVPLKSREVSENELHKLYDAWEFQETEVIKARDKMRSIRAKLSVLEGKMSLKTVEAHKILEEKQIRISSAQRALSLLRTACIIWPNTASEVFLCGSFDGWTSQRRMEKSGTGLFSLYLKLYPGQYEERQRTSNIRCCNMEARDNCTRPRRRRARNKSNDFELFYGKECSCCNCTRLHHTK